MSSLNKKSIVVTLLLVMIVLFFQNCSQHNSSINSNTQLTLSNNVSAIHWRYTTGLVPPSNQYDIEYDVDFPTKNLTIIASKGASVTGQPDSGTKSLSDAQLSNIRALLDQIAYVNCDMGSGPVSDSGIDELGVYTTSMSSANVLVYHSNCSGNPASNANQDKSGYLDLTDFLKSL